MWLRSNTIDCSSTEYEYDIKQDGASCADGVKSVVNSIEDWNKSIAALEESGEPRSGILLEHQTRRHNIHAGALAYAEPSRNFGVMGESN